MLSWILWQIWSSKSWTPLQLSSTQHVRSIGARCTHATRRTYTNLINVNYKPQIFRQHFLMRQQEAAKITVVNNKLLIMDDLGFVPLSRTGSELLFEVFSQRYERGSVLVTTNLPFDEWTEMFGSERLTGALLDRLTHHVHIIEMNGDSYRLRQSGRPASE